MTRFIMPPGGQWPPHVPALPRTTITTDTHADQRAEPRVDDAAEKHGELYRLADDGNPLCGDVSELG